MTSTRRRLLLFFALLGLAASTTSSVVHYRLLTEPGYSSFCDVSRTVSCTEAYLSRFGSLFGVPVALAGVLFFALVFVVGVVGGRQASAVRENVSGYIFALSTLGLAVVLYLAWAAFFVLKAFCILCGITYVAVIALFVVSGAATSFPMTTLPRRAVRDLRVLVASPLALIIAIVLIGGGVTAASLFPREGVQAPVQAPTEFPPLTPEQKTQLAAWWDVQPKVDMPFSSDGAKVLVVKFNDFQCPPCRSTFEGYKGILAKYIVSGDIKFVLKHFPLDPECNSATPGGQHLAACEAAAADVLARRRGNGDKMEQWLFDHQASLTPASVKEAARTVGGIPDFDAEYQRGLEQVKTDAGLGALIGVRGTPTFVVNGRRIDSVLDPRAFNAVIQLERSKPHTK